MEDEAALRAAMARCEAATDYAGAERVRRELEKLRRAREAEADDALTARHRGDRTRLSAWSERERAALHEQWSRKASAEKVRARHLVEALLARQEGEQRELYERLATHVVAPRFSERLISLRRAQLSAAREHAFVEAARFKEEADCLEREERDALRRQAKTRHLARFEKLLERQHSEKVALRERLLSEKKAAEEAFQAASEQLERRIRYQEEAVARAQARDRDIAERRRARRDARAMTSPLKAWEASISR